MRFGEVLDCMAASPFVNNPNIPNDERPRYRKFRRKAWGPSIQYIFLTAETRVPVDKWQGDLPPFNNGKHVLINPHIDMIGGEGSLLVGWMPYQFEMLVDDWEEVTE